MLIIAIILSIAFYISFSVYYYFGCNLDYHADEYENNTFKILKPGARFGLRVIELHLLLTDSKGKTFGKEFPIELSKWRKKI